LPDPDTPISTTIMRTLLAGRDAPV
jgi:hypothetical protein